MPASILPVKSLEDSPYEIVDTKERMMEIIDQLQKESIISFDIREHTVRTYLGIICMIMVHSQNSPFPLGRYGFL